jgi:AAA domain
MSWLWPGYIPRGTLTLLDGDPGLGKSMLTLDLAARLSTGRPMPDGTGGGQVEASLILQAEDGTATTVLPRLVAAGADVAHVHIFAHADGRPVRLPRNFPGLDRAIHAANIRLVIFDPLISFLAPKVWMGSDQQVRRVMARLAAIAQQTGCAIVLVRHLNKTAGQRAMYRGLGTIGIVGAARAGLLVATDSQDRDRKVLTATKVNLGRSPTGLAYRIVGNESGIATIAWDGPVDLTADEALNPKPAKAEPKMPMGVILATEWLLTTLKAGPRLAVDVYKDAIAAGFSERTLERAKRPAHVESRFVVNKGTNEKRWVWRLYQQPKYLDDLGPLPDIYGLDEGWDV